MALTLSPKDITRSQTCHVARYFLRSVSTSFISRNVTPEAVALSFSGETEEENMSLDPKTSTSRVTISRLSSRKVLSLKLPAAFPASILKETDLL